MGRGRKRAALRDTYPVPEDCNSLETHLAELERLQLTLRGTSTANPAFEFRHAITQEVAYNLLPYAQRRELHRRAATWYEHHRAAASGYPLLAYLWERAGKSAASVHFSTRSGKLCATRRDDGVIAMDLPADPPTVGDPPPGLQEALRGEGTEYAAGTGYLHYHRLEGDDGKVDEDGQEISTEGEETDVTVSADGGDGTG